MRIIKLALAVVLSMCLCFVGAPVAFAQGTLGAGQVLSIAPIMSESITVGGYYIHASSDAVQIRQVDGFNYDPSTKTLTIKGSTINVPKDWSAGWVNIHGIDNINIKINGTINATAKSADDPFLINTDGGATVSGGTINVKNMGAVEAAGNLNVKSGTWTGKNTDNGLFHVSKTLNVSKKAKLNASVKKGAAYAVVADKMVNNPKSLKKWNGYLPQGAKFYGSTGYNIESNKKKSIWQQDEEPNMVKLIQFNELDQHLYFRTYGISINNLAYNINAIGSNAFNTKYGKRPLLLTIGNEMDVVDKNAFKGFKGTFDLNSDSLWTDINGKIVKKSGVSKKAFNGMSKKADVEVDLEKNKTLSRLKAVKSALMKCGLKKATKVKYYDKNKWVI